MLEVPVPEYSPLPSEPSPVDFAPALPVLLPAVPAAPAPPPEPPAAPAPATAPAPALLGLPALALAPAPALPLPALAALPELPADGPGGLPAIPPPSPTRSFEAAQPKSAAENGTKQAKARMRIDGAGYSTGEHENARARAMAII